MAKASRTPSGSESAGWNDSKWIGRWNGVIEIGDKATGGAALSDIYQQMALKPVIVDLSDLWKQLGVHRSGNTVAFDNQAPLAAIRASIAGWSRRE